MIQDEQQEEEKRLNNFIPFERNFLLHFLPNFQGL